MTPEAIEEMDRLKYLSLYMQANYKMKKLASPSNVTQLIPILIEDFDKIKKVALI